MTDFGNGPEPQEHISSGTDEIAASSQNPNAHDEHAAPAESSAPSGASESAPATAEGSEHDTGAPEHVPAAPAEAEPHSATDKAPIDAQTDSAEIAAAPAVAPSVEPTGAAPQEAATQPVTDEIVEPATASTDTAAGGSGLAESSATAESNAVAEGTSAAEGSAAVESTAAGEGSATVEGSAGVESGSEAGSDQGAEGATAEGATTEGATTEGATTEGAPRRGQRSWRPPRLTKEEMREIWTELQAKKEAAESIDLEVVGHNRGGVVTQYRGLEVFLPMSHWSLERNASAEPGEIRTGSTVQANILEITDFDTDARRVTATRRALLRHNVLGTHAIGERVKGKVSSIHDFGIFVDLGGVDGLVHASEISHVRGRHPSELVKIGDEVDVVVKEIDPQRERIYLGMKELGPSPWDHVEERYPEGSVVQGKVVGFSKNGAFVEVEPGIEGFIRMRELSWTKRVQRPKDILKKSAEIPVHVLEVSGRRQRLSLSYRQAIEDPWPQIAEKYAVGTTWKGAITELSNKGVVVDIGEVEGFLPRGRMGREAKRLPDMKAGDELEVNVIEVDAERNSLIFGLPGQESAGFERSERSEGGGGERRQGGGFSGERTGGGGERGAGGERSGGGERSAGGERSGGGQRGSGDRGERRDRGDRRDRDRGPVVPAKAVDEMKSAETVGNFSLGDLLGDQIKSKLGIKDEPKKERRREGEGGADQSASAKAPATAPAVTPPASEATPDAQAAESSSAEQSPGVDETATLSAHVEQSSAAENHGGGEVPIASSTELPAPASIENGSSDHAAEHTESGAAGEQEN